MCLGSRLSWATTDSDLQAGALGAVMDSFHMTHYVSIYILVQNNIKFIAPSLAERFLAPCLTCLLSSWLISYYYGSLLSGINIILTANFIDTSDVYVYIHLPY